MIEIARSPKSSLSPITRPYLGPIPGYAAELRRTQKPPPAGADGGFILEPHGFESLHIHTANAVQNDDANRLKLRHNVASPFQQPLRAACAM